MLNRGGILAVEGIDVGGGGKGEGYVANPDL